MRGLSMNFCRRRARLDLSRRMRGLSTTVQTTHFQSSAFPPYARLINFAVIVYHVTLPFPPYARLIKSKQGFPLVPLGIPPCRWLIKLWAW